MARILTHQNICRKVKHKPNSVTKNVNLRHEKDDYGNSLDRINKIQSCRSKSKNKTYKTSNTNNRDVINNKLPKWKEQSDQLRQLMKFNRMQNANSNGEINIVEKSKLNKLSNDINEKM